MRVRAVKGTKRAPSGSEAITPRRSPRVTMLLPSGVSSGSEASTAAAASSPSETPGMGRNSAAWRLP